jgi:O-antigen/teichoic acid export membrane protein
MTTYWQRTRAVIASRFGSSAFWLVLDRVVRLGGGLLVSLLMARALGPTDFGLYSYALALVSFTLAIGTLGLDGILVRELVRSPDTAPATLGSAALLRWGAGLCGVAAAAVGALLLRPADSLFVWLTLVLALAAPLHASQVIDFWFQAQQTPRNVVLARIMAFGLLALVRVGMILVEAPLIAFAWAIWSEALIGALGVNIAYWRSGGRMAHWQITWGALSHLVRDGVPLLVAALLITLYLRMDQIMIGWLIDEQALGMYAVAVRLAEPWPLLPVTVIGAALPVMVRLRESDPLRFEQRMRQIYAVVSLYGYVVGISATLLAPLLVPLLLGPAFRDAIPSTIVLVWAGLFVGLGSARSMYFTALRWTDLHTLTVALGALTNLLLNLWLIPLYGAFGAALASLIAYWMAVHGACLLIPRLWPTARMIAQTMFWPKFW